MLRSQLVLSLALCDALSLSPSCRCSSVCRPALAPRRARDLRCAEDEDGGRSLLDGLIPKEKNPYRTNKADRMREAFGEGSVVRQSLRSGGRDAAEDRLAEDIARFKVERGLPSTVGLDQPGANYAEANGKEEEMGMLQNVINTLGNVLTVNFFIIIAFFTWFLAAVGAQFGAENFVLINAFRDCWDVLILPLLSTHMALTFLSFGLEKVATSQEA